MLREDSIDVHLLRRFLVCLSFGAYQIRVRDSVSQICMRMCGDCENLSENLSGSRQPRGEVEDPLSFDDNDAACC